MPTTYYKTTDPVTPLLEILPLESNGPGNLSVPRQLVDVEFIDKNFVTPTDAFVLNDDVSARFVQGFQFSVIGSTLYDGTYTVNGGAFAPGDTVAQVVDGKTHIPVTDIVTTSVPYSFIPAAATLVSPTTPHNYLVTWQVQGNLTAVIAANDSIQIKRFLYNSVRVTRTYTVVSVTYTGTFTNIVTSLYDDSITTPVLGVDTQSVVVSPAPTPADPGYIQYTVPTSATSLGLVGKGVPAFNATTSWGTAMQANLIHMLENFAHTVEPASPLTGQLWFDTNTGAEALQLRNGAVWHGIVAEGLPVQGNLNLNNFKVAAVADAVTTYPYVASTTGWGNNDQEVMNLRTSDALYIAKTGGYNASASVRSGTMTGSLNMTGTADVNFKAGGSGNLTFESTATGGIVVDGSGSVTVASGNVVATAGNMRVGSGTNQVVTQNNAGSAPTITFTTSTTGNNVINLSNNMLTGLSTPVLSTDATNKAYVDSFVSGIIWLTPVYEPNLFNDALSAPPADDGFTKYHKTFIVAGTGTGAWTGFNGHLMTWNGTTWESVLGRAVTIGDRFGVFCEPDNDDPLSSLPGGGLTGHAGKIATVTGVSPYTYSFYTPAEPDAFSVKGIANASAAQSPHMGHSYTFRGVHGTGSFGTGYAWIEFSGPQMIVDGAGLAYDASTLNVDGNLLALFNLSATGVVTRTGANTIAARTLAGTSNNIVVTNGDGVSGNPTIDLAAVTQGSAGTSFVKVALDGFGRVTNNTAVAAADITTLVDGTYVNVAGDTMTGSLTLNADPSSALHAATKQYVDVARAITFNGTAIGTVSASAKTLLAITSQAFTIPATPNATSPCYGYGDVAATAQTDFDIQKNGVSVGTMSFAAAANAATFTFASPVSFAAGDRLAVIAPGTPDTTLADVYFTIRGTLV